MLSLISYGLISVRTGNNVPVILTVECPFIRIGVVAELKVTNFANAVTVFVGMLFLIYGFNVVTAVSSVPVIDCIDRVVRAIGVSMIIVPFTTVADTVVVAVEVSCLISNFDCVATSYSVPVVFGVTRPCVSELMLVIVVPSASVADTVIVFISVSSFVSNLDVVTASYIVPVIISVVRPCVSELMLVVVVPCANVTYGVVVLINVSSQILNGT